MKLVDYRYLRGITKQEAAKELDVHPSNYGRWEEGKTIPDPDQIRRIKAWSKNAVTADDLIGEEAKQ